MVVGESASLSESLAEVEIVPRPERIPEEERNDEELLIDPDSEEEAELDSDDEVFKLRSLFFNGHVISIFWPKSISYLFQLIVPDLFKGGGA